MANTLVQFRADETLRLKAHMICERLGIDLPTYMRICMTRLVEENGIPFSMKLDGENKGIRAMKAAAAAAKESGASEMTLEEINEEIAAARKS